MGVAWRAAVVLAVFAGVGWLTSHAVQVHELANGAVGAEVRLSAWMAGLFAGGAAALVAGIALVMTRRR
ncbi:MAG TPA: hypothetical protein VLI45_04775 [Acidobacteriaceae bacterium]|nr:hypothetical protein [Acidobacteriaceae bacterium]